MASVSNGKALYNNILFSIRTFAAIVGEEISLITGVPLEPVDYDAFASEMELPEKNTIGPSNLNFQLNGKVIELEVCFGITTLADVNGENLHKCCSELFDRLMPEQNIPYRDSVTGEQLNLMTIAAGTKAMPMTTGKDSKRPTRFFIITAFCGETVHR